MWLSQAYNRGFVRMRRIFYGMRDITGWDHPFSAFIGLWHSSDAYTKPIFQDAQIPLQLHPVKVSTTSEKPLTWRSRSQRISGG